VEAVGIEPTYSRLRGGALASVGSHFRSAIPRGFEPPISSVTGRRLMPLGHGIVSVVGVGVEPTMTALSERCLAAWLPHNAKLAELSKTARTVPRAGVEPDLGGLKDRRPHRKSNGAHLTIHSRSQALPGNADLRGSASFLFSEAEPGNENRPGGRFSPRPARVSQLARGVIRSYPDQAASRLRPPDASSPSRSRRQGRRPSGEVHSSRARGSWWYVDGVSCGWPRVVIARRPYTLDRRSTL
jgi:hypothetical protein